MLVSRWIQADAGIPALGGVRGRAEGVRIVTREHARLLRILRAQAAAKRKAGPTKWEKDRRAEIRAARFAGIFYP